MVDAASAGLVKLAWISSTSEPPRLLTPGKEFLPDSRSLNDRFFAWQGRKASYFCSRSPASSIPTPSTTTAFNVFSVRGGQEGMASRKRFGLGSAFGGHAPPTRDARKNNVFFLTECRGGTRIITREIFVVACGTSNMRVRFGAVSRGGTRRGLDHGVAHARLGLRLHLNLHR